MSNEIVRSVMRGQINVYGQAFYADALIGLEGARVFVTYDDDNNSAIKVHSEDGEFIAEAERVMPKAFSADVIEAFRERRRVGREARIAQAMDEIREERRLVLESDCKEIVCPHCLAVVRAETPKLESTHLDLQLLSDDLLRAEANDLRFV
ncbi:Mu transposase C-terminal domain-containing protein [Methylomonas sp. EFPC1]|uniref:Mu transposase C-terminal domain-containing protein n=1 Tax=Methylomonas sp. EFPC1 TaxID=2812647 RepID=UPI0019674167|nr:Mu transposase C-terminal domain-containing protein [Methylomonas sp. EFPC1]QSB02675.1 Mu transposase C-terminal domain-containing protein [Methylomonas sp. EFPC1]